MSAPELESRYPSWKIALLYLVATLLCAGATAQTPAASVKPQTLLTPWTTLNGAFIAAVPDANSARVTPPQFSGYLTWLSPTLVTARGNYVYVVDGARQQIFRYDLARQSMAPLADYVASAVTAIALAPDLSLYVADSQARQVLHFSVDGRLLQRFYNEFELARPVAAWRDEASGNLWVADSLYKHVVLFNSLGRVLSVLRSNQARSIEAMVPGPDGLYLLDRLGRQVVVIGHDGTDRYTLGQGTLKMPGAIAVDRFNRVFVSDSFDNTLKVYEQGQLVSSIGGSAGTPASFNQITGLWIDQNMLYVVDRLNARIQTFHVAPPALQGRARD